MHDVAVYLSSIPRISDHNRKVQVLRAFAEGAKVIGAQVIVQTERKVVPAHLAVIIGWVGKTIRGPHIQLRKDVIESQKNNDQKIMCIDGSCFKYADHDNLFLRYSLDSVYYNQNIYANKNSNDKKWQLIRDTLGLEYQDWRENGNHVLVCLQRDGGWNMKDTNLSTWAKETVQKLRKHTDRPILIRPHPKNPIDPKIFQDVSNVRISHGTSLRDDIENAWASVFFNSSSAVASILAGVPVFVHDDDCVAWDVANHDISDIESPILLDRDQWLWDLAAAHRSDEESRQGLIYRAFERYL